MNVTNYTLKNVTDYSLGKKMGLNEAWKAVRKIVAPVDDGGLSSEELIEIFGYDIFQNIFTAYDATEVIDRITRYEKTHKFEIGDEVTKDCNMNLILKGVITRIEGDSVYIMWSDGSSGSESKKYLKKTGKVYSQIKEVLDQLNKKSAEE